MSNRPEWVVCVRETHEERKDKTWCGRQLYPTAQEFVFESIDHAAYSNLNHARLVPCAECLAKVLVALRMKELQVFTNQQ